MKKQIFSSIDQAKTYAAENWNYPLTKHNHGAADCNCGQSQAIWSDDRDECLVICENCHDNEPAPKRPYFANFSLGKIKK